ncbi:reverse transcriptase [Gossypium australe]|uniref:Reverse transcriptase n=1 Tax=Gossypium australe TaxID=47621 RepID=A0A5B6WIW5_9ROSI|nr:reverse transcriptase [Gossypium australe]
MKWVLSEYEVCSGQSINYEKFTVFFSSNTSRHLNDTERYLGLPNLVGRRKKMVFQGLKDRFRKKIDNWSTRFLSQEGKEVFIKAILQAIPMYSMMCFLLPKSFCWELESIMA